MRPGRGVWEASPEFSRPYSAFFCSSSSCCLLCLQTKHLEETDGRRLPYRAARAGVSVLTAKSAKSEA